MFIKSINSVITLKKSSKAIEHIPSDKSEILVLWRFWKTLEILSIKPEDENFNPKSPLSCEAAIITEVADVNPTVTGIDIKSTSTPKNNNIV